MKTLTIVCPAYNEGEGIAHFAAVLKEQLTKLSHYDSYILFVDDGSKDNTYETLRHIARSDTHVRAIRFSRNFGHQMALLAGLDHALSDVVITMDSDLQHPPSVIPALIAEYEKGNDIVYTVRNDTESVGLLRRIIGKLFYWFLNKMSEVPISENASDFRLMSGRVVEVIRSDIGERNMFLRGIIRWVGFKQSEVHFTTGRRYAGASKYSLARLLQLAVAGIISFSKVPLRAAIIVGALFALIGFIVAIITVIQSLTSSSLPAGWATVVVLLSIFGGVQLIFLGVLGEYIGAIFDEVKRRPRYIVEDSVNITVKHPE
ncbi:glycosyl transferase [Candidatus Adlerbacteria bacterium RIFCSPLOWO2_01_FULL_51_16]|uniref:Glycosyl transferase n=1 Tax=Candidatus Adlerbacteria bacterium RIFCSPLOWO2_01_FULL_51_16 TaxID=1797243 RepID=A0A1F4XF01_9BACT|nr:MAG: glycosyl transferase [Candidatus Adlerbacteria bacterium RIFCSPLOWO2_01_FULL_51_16]